LRPENTELPTIKERMMALHLESWANAMPAISSRPPPSLHRIGILLSPVGRFLQCGDCKLTFVFPDEVQYGALAKQFESHLCISPLRISAWQVKSRVPDKPVPNSQRSFVILRYDGKVPAMASCAKCARKFFTPATIARDAVGAHGYLGQKFDLHVCGENRGESNGQEFKRPE
jgi:hypothetical protein